MPGNNPTMYQRARKMSPYTQEQAAERLYVSEKTVKAWEQGRRLPDNGAVARMAELYNTPWLLLEHAMETGEALGILPENITIQGLPTAVLTLINRATQLADDYRRLMRIAEDGVIDEAERPDFAEISANIQGVIAAGFQVLYAEPAGHWIKRDRSVAATTKRSGFQDLRHKNDSKNIISHLQENARPNFARGGGVSL